LEKLRPLKKVCALIRFHQIRIPLIVATLRKICQKEGIEADFEALERIAQNSGGDVRSAINDLQSLSESDRKLTLQDTSTLSLRNRDINMEETLRQYFSVKSIVEASTLLNRSNVDYDDLLLSVSDNLPRRYPDTVEMAKAYDQISHADVFRGRIGTENWHLLKYFYNSMSKAASINPQSQKSFDLISPPIRIITLFWTKGKRTILETICGKIGAQCHVSRNTAKEKIVPFLKILLEKEKYYEILTWLKLTPEEVDFLKKMNKM
jgi:replication factor C large subunit